MRRSDGAALIILMMLVAIITIALVTSSLNHSQNQLNRDKKTEEALAMAKEALIAYAAQDSNRPGELPCPDWNGDGSSVPITDYYSQGGNIICTTYTGYLPWKTLRLPDLRDGNGERLWYSVTLDFHAGSTAQLNTDTPGQINITGTNPASNVIAIIISPGQILSGQAQDSTYQNQAILTNPANYLEGSNATGGTNTNFVTATTSTTFNDRILPITHHDLFQAVTARVAGQFRSLFSSDYSSSDFPQSLNDIYTYCHVHPTIESCSFISWFQANWDSPITTYNQISGSNATVQFDGCINSIFTIKNNSGDIVMTKSGLC